MGWFSKEKTRIELITDSFIEEYPVWASQHSTKLIDELISNAAGLAEGTWKQLLQDNKNIVKLTNIFTGAHGVFLMINPEGAIVSALFGEKTIEKCIKLMPPASQNFALLTFASNLKRTEKEGNNIIDSYLTSLEEYFKIKINPLDAHVAFVATDEIIGGDTDQVFSPTLTIAGLLPTLNRLQQEQLTWLKDFTGRHLK